MVRTGTALLVTALIALACGGGAGSTTGPTAGSTAPPSAALSAAPSEEATAAPTSGGETGTVCENLPSEAEGDLLATICEAGVIRVATDPIYPPQSELLPDGTFEGFDIDTANAIGERLGVEVQFETPNFDEVVAGGWAERFDMSVGSVTITSDREDLLDFTQPYYYTPAQMGATEESGITSLEELAGETVCVGETTTYFYWLEGTLSLAGDVPDPAPVPEGAQATTFSTDTECAEAVSSGRTDFAGWLTSSTTLDNSIEGGAPFVVVGEPVFYEALAVALDKSAPDHDQLLAAIDQIIGELHADGTLSESSMSWFNGLDLTKSE